MGRGLTDAAQAGGAVRGQGIPGMNLGEAQNRQFVLDVLRQLQATHFEHFDPHFTKSQRFGARARRHQNVTASAIHGWRWPHQGWGTLNTTTDDSHAAWCVVENTHNRTKRHSKGSMQEAMRAMGINRADGTPLTLKLQLAIMMGRLNANQLDGHEQGRNLLFTQRSNGQRIFDSGKKRRAIR